MSLQLQHERHTDVLYADLCFPNADERVDVFDVGEQVGFPGQVFVRVNLENGTMYGLTIQNFSSFKKQVRWRYRMASINEVLLLLVNTFRAALSVSTKRNYPVHTA